MQPQKGSYLWHPPLSGAQMLRTLGSQVDRLLAALEEAGEPAGRLADLINSMGAVKGDGTPAPLEEEPLPLPLPMPPEVRSNLEAAIAYLGYWHCLERSPEEIMARLLATDRDVFRVLQQAGIFLYLARAVLSAQRDTPGFSTLLSAGGGNTPGRS